MTLLQNRTIVITRASEDASELRERLCEQGAQVIEAPCVSFRAVDFAVDWHNVAWIIFCSKHAVEFFAGRSTVGPAVKIAAVAPATAQLAMSHFGHVDAVSQIGTARDLAQVISQIATPSQGAIVLVSSQIGRAELAELLVAAGFEVRRWVAYETVVARAEDGALQLPEKVDGIVFTSPSTVAGFMARAVIPSSAQVFCLGPTTQHALSSAGINHVHQAEQPTLAALMQLITKVMNHVR